MPDQDKLLDLDALRKQEREGIMFGAVRYPWAMIGPIEQAKFLGLQAEIRAVTGAPDLDQVEAAGDDEEDVTVDQMVEATAITLEEAEEVAALQRDVLKLILPTLTPEAASELADEEVAHVIRFFENWRNNLMIGTMEDQWDPVEKAMALRRRAEQIGATLSPRSRGFTGGIPPAG